MNQDSFRHHTRSGNFLSTGLLLVLTLSCSMDPARRIDKMAGASGFERIEITGTRFRHILYMRLPGTPVDTVHVYLEGDGSPWFRERYINADPTPRNPVALQLMAADTAAVIYLGRPCYHGFADDPPCTAAYWTSARYSEAVVESLLAVLNTLVQRHKISNIVLIGYSGGGTLAMLLAGRLDQTRGVVTVAGNLDIDGWTAFHGYTPLHASINPKTQPALSGNIFQLHFYGEADRVIPPFLTREAINTGNTRNVNLELVAGFNHACCWVEYWPEFLKTFLSRYENSNDFSPADKRNKQDFTRTPGAGSGVRLLDKMILQPAE